ncbi:MAG: hypothetical protein WC314_00840 [Vulcanimicrobiota bacterium]
MNVEQLTTLEHKIGRFSDILEQKPGDGLTVLALAEASFRRGLRLEALTAYQAVTREKPVPEAHLAVAEIYSQQGMLNEAYGELAKLFEVDPENVEARLLAHILTEEVDPPSAVAEMLNQPTSDEAFDEARLRLQIQLTIHNRELQERTRNVTLDPGVVVNEYYVEEAKKKLLEVQELLRKLEELRAHNEQLRFAPRPDPVSARPVIEESVPSLSPIGEFAQEPEAYSEPAIELTLDDSQPLVSDPVFVPEPVGHQAEPYLEVPEPVIAVEPPVMESTELEVQIPEPIALEETPSLESQGPVETETYSSAEEVQQDWSIPASAVSVEDDHPEPISEEQAVAPPVPEPVVEFTSTVEPDLPDPMEAFESISGETPEPSMTLESIPADLPEVGEDGIHLSLVADPSYTMPLDADLGSELVEEARTEYQDLETLTPVVSEADESAQDPGPEPIPQPVLESIEQSVEEPIEEPLVDPVEEPYSGKPSSQEGLAARQAYYESKAGELGKLTGALARTRGVTSIFLVSREGITIDSVAQDEVSEQRIGELVKESFEFLLAYAASPTYWVLECTGGIFVMQTLDARHVLIAVGQAGANFGALRYSMDRAKEKFALILDNVPA